MRRGEEGFLDCGANGRQPTLGHGPVLACLLAATYLRDSRKPHLERYSQADGWCRVKDVKDRVDGGGDADADGDAGRCRRCVMCKSRSERRLSWTKL